MPNSWNDINKSEIHRKTQPVQVRAIGNAPSYVRGDSRRERLVVAVKRGGYPAELSGALFRQKPVSGFAVVQPVTAIWSRTA